MKEFIVVGRPNCGKTLFTLNFASFLGCKTVDITFRSYDGILDCKHLTIEEAKQLLSGISLHKTKMLQSIILKVSIGKTAANFKLTDTCGLSESIHTDQKIRCGMAQTISLLRYADFIFHMIDLSMLTSMSIDNCMSTIDREIYSYGLCRHNYLILANKDDLPSTKENLTKVKEQYPMATILPLSAINKTGFKEVRACVARNI